MPHPRDYATGRFAYRSLPGTGIDWANACRITQYPARTRDGSEHHDWARVEYWNAPGATVALPTDQLYTVDGGPAADAEAMFAEFAAGLAQASRG